MNNTTIDKMRQMRLFGMSRAFQSSMEKESIQYTPDELITYLVDAEWDDKNNRKIDRLTKFAKFTYKSSIEQVTFNDSRNIEKNQILRFANCDFINNKENILITGSTGVGKSFIASAIGHQACALKFKVLYFNAAKLFSKLKIAKADGSYLKEINKIERHDLLILDDFGLNPLDNVGRHDFMEIIEDRHGKRSTIISSQLPVNKWHEIIAEQTIADAILDRIVHNAHRLELKGESMRKLKSKINVN